MYLLLDFPMSKYMLITILLLLYFLPMPGLTTRVENDMFWCEIGIRMLLFLSYSREIKIFKKMEIDIK